MDFNKKIKDLEKDGFSEVGATTSEAWDFEKNPEFNGVFIEKQTNVGKNNSSLYVFEADNNQRYGVWGSSVLDTRLKNLVPGEEVFIFYLGKEQSEKTGRTYKNFKVFHRAIAGRQSTAETGSGEVPLSAYEEEL